MNAKYPPGPRDGLFGVTFHAPLQADPLGFMTRVAREHGDFAFVRVGWVRLYFVNRPELIREVLTTKIKSFRKLGRQMKALRKIEGEGLVVSHGRTWARHRPVVQGSFHARHMKEYARLVVEHTERRLARWAANEPFDLAAEMNELAMEIIARIVFGVDLSDQVSRLRDAVHVFRAAMQKQMSNPLSLPDWLPLPGKIRQRRALRDVDDLIWDLIRAQSVGPGRRRHAGPDAGGGRQVGPRFPYRGPRDPRRSGHAVRGRPRHDVGVAGLVLVHPVAESRGRTPGHPRGGRCGRAANSDL